MPPQQGTSVIVQIHGYPTGVPAHPAEYKLEHQVYDSRQTVIWNAVLCSKDGSPGDGTAPASIAIKYYVPPPASGTPDSEQYTPDKRLDRERRALSRLENEPGVVQLVGVVDGQKALALEWMDADPLRVEDASRDTTERLKSCLDWLISIYEAMITARAKSVLHGDIRTSNILFNQFGVAKLSDWDSAHVYGSSRDDAKPRQFQTDRERLVQIALAYLEGQPQLAEVEESCLDADGLLALINRSRILPADLKLVFRDLASQHVALDSQLLDNLAAERGRLEERQLAGPGPFTGLGEAMVSVGLGLRNMASQVAWGTYVLYVHFFRKHLVRTLILLGLAFGIWYSVPRLWPWVKRQAEPVAQQVCASMPSGPLAPLCARVPKPPTPSQPEVPGGQPPQPPSPVPGTSTPTPSQKTTPAAPAQVLTTSPSPVPSSVVTVPVTVIVPVTPSRTPVPPWQASLSNMRYERWLKPDNTTCIVGNGSEWQRFAVDILLVNESTSDLPQDWRVIFTSGGNSVEACIIRADGTTLLNPSEWVNMDSSAGKLQNDQYSIPVLRPNQDAIRSFAVFLPVGKRVAAVELTSKAKNRRQTWQLGASGDVIGAAEWR